MNAEALLKHYERIADAPDAVGRLRRFVLDLAVRGKLVGQDSHEESGAKLLIRVAQITGRSAAAAVGPKPFELPSGWEWSTVGQVTTKTGSGSTPRGGKEVYQPEGVPFLRSQNIHDDGLRLDDVVFVDAKTHERMSGTAVESGDLLLNITGGSIGRCCLLGREAFEANISQHVAIIRLAFREIGAYAHAVIRSPYFQTFVIDEQTGAGRGGLPKNRMDRILIPIPPLAEQHRIVAKVDELMALCDRLEAARAEREATRDRLAAASLARLNTPDTDHETFKAHASFAISTALPAFTTRPDQIKQLRQTILNLAVRGKLVAQDSSDAPASQFLSELAEEISTYCTFNRVRRTIPSDISEIPFAPPSGWQWTRLSELFSVITDGDHQPPPKSGEGVAFLTIGNVTSGRLDFSDCRLVSEDYFNAIPKYRVPERGDILYTVVGATFGRPCPVDTNRPFCVQRHIAILKPAAGTNQQFLLRLLSSPLIYSQAAAATTGTAQPTIALAPLRSFLVPVPPIEEQHRIVEKVNKLMQLCNQLEASLESGADIRRCLLDALLHEALLPMNGKVIDFAAARQRLQEQRESIACRVVQRLGPTRGFGRVRAMKPLYWAEAHCGAALGGQWGRAEAGPFDQWIFNFEAHAASAGWFSVTEHRNGDKVAKAEYRAGTGLSAKAAGAAEALGSEAPEFERVLSLLADLNTEDSEIVTTLYAAWNDLLLEGKPFSDAAVITDVREHWHPSKARFTPALLQTWLDWLRKNRLVPKGKGPNTRHQPELI